MNTRNIKKLQEKKHRNESGLFLVEGEKNVTELLASDFIIRDLYCTEEFVARNKKAIAEGTFTKKSPTPYVIVNASELASFGTKETNNAALAIVEQKKQIQNTGALLTTLEKPGTIILALDAISDPGNLGTIIRIADWFGVEHIVASAGTVDCYNPKVIAATMGSFVRVSVHQAALPDFLASAKKKSIPVIGAMLDGTDLRKATLPKSAILVLGSESHGISKEIKKLLTTSVTIPRYGKAESLNVAAAGAILLEALRR